MLVVVLTCDDMAVIFSFPPSSPGRHINPFYFVLLLLQSRFKVFVFGFFVSSVIKGVKRDLQAFI